MGGAFPVHIYTNTLLYPTMSTTARYRHPSFLFSKLRVASHFRLHSPSTGPIIEISLGTVARKIERTNRLNSMS